MHKTTLGRNFTTISLLKFALPTITMMVFMSFYIVVDGLFVANFVGEHGLSAINLVSPIFNLVTGVALMFATGGSAVIGKFLGQHQEIIARRFFTLIYLVGLATGIIFAFFSLLFPGQILIFLGTSETLMPFALAYLRPIAFFFPVFFLQVFTQTFFVTTGKPTIGLSACLIGGLANIFFDWLFIAIFGWGIAGAALATGIGCLVPGLFGLLYFIFNRHSLLHFLRPVWQPTRLLLALSNGTSEFISNISVAITTFLFNLILLRLAGEAGVAAISIIIYIQILQTAVYMGYCFGVLPIISYKYGAKNHLQLQKITRVSLGFVLLVSLLTFLITLIFAPQLSNAFIDQNSPTYDLTVTGMRIFSFAYLFMGINIFTSTLFTALSNGKISALIAFLRSLFLAVPLLLFLPELLGTTGVWLAIPIAELITLLVAFYCLRRYRQRYHF